MVTENGAGTLPLTYQFCQNKTTLPEKYLIMVDPEKNNNKFYRMVDLGNHTWGAMAWLLQWSNQRFHPDYIAGGITLRRYGRPGVR